MAYHFKNLVFEGGGVKGIAYVGALEVLDEKGILIDIKRVAGTSVGAMIAVMVGLHYTAEEMREVLWGLKFKKFLDKSFGLGLNIKRLAEDYGWYKGDYFRDLMADLIKNKTGNGEITFGKLAATKKYMDIHLVGADLSTGTSRTFNAKETPNVKIADAARVSMSIPLFFASMKSLKGDENNKDHIFVDGGLLDNYSIKAFDKYSYVFDKKNNARRTE